MSYNEVISLSSEITTLISKISFINRELINLISNINKSHNNSSPINLSLLLSSNIDLEEV